MLLWFLTRLNAYSKRAFFALEHSGHPSILMELAHVQSIKILTHRFFPTFHSGVTIWHLHFGRQIHR
jgi:hypothetical protein